MTFPSSISNYTLKLELTHSEDQTHHCDFRSNEKRAFIAAKMVFKNYRIEKGSLLDVPVPLASK